MEFWPFMDACGCHSHSKLYHYVILLLCFSIFHHPPHPRNSPTPAALPPTPHIQWHNINEFHEKYRQKLAKISHYLFTRLVVQKLIDTVDLENFGVKKLRKAQTSMKLKHTRFFYYDNFTF